MPRCAGGCAMSCLRAGKIDVARHRSHRSQSTKAACIQNAACKALHASTCTLLDILEKRRPSKKNEKTTFN